MSRGTGLQYEQKSDLALTGLAAVGDEDAVMTLLSRYLPLVRSCAREYGAPEEFEDLCQEGMIGLLTAIRTFDPTRSSFSSYAWLCVHRMLSTFRRSAHRQKKLPADATVPLDGLAETLWASAQDSPESIVIDRENYHQLIARVNRRLTKLEQAVLTHYLTGASYYEIARRLDIPEKGVDNAIQRIRRKLR